MNGQGRSLVLPFQKWLAPFQQQACLRITKRLGHLLSELKMQS
jgi:hypothetical protein